MRQLAVAAGEASDLCRRPLSYRCTHSSALYTGYQSTRHTVISSHGHADTRSSRHRSTRHTRFSSHSQLVTNNKTTSTSRNYLQAVRHPETVLNTDGVITAICVTKCILHRTDHGDRLHFYETRGQLVTAPRNTTVNSSHDFTM